MRNGDYTATVTFLGKFFEFTEGVVELRAIRNQGGAYPPAFVSSAAQIIAYCQRYDMPGSAVYFGCCTRLAPANRGRREDLFQLPALWADIDCLKLGLDIVAVVVALLACPLPPSLIVMSGGGLHVYWHLTEPLSVAMPGHGEADVVREEVEAALRQLAGVFCGDDNACDLPRILRPAGTHNSKLAELRPVTVLWPEGLLTDADVYIDRRYEFADIVEVLDWLGPVIEAPGRQVYLPTAERENDPFSRLGKDCRIKPPVDIEARLSAMTYQGEGETGIHATRLSVSASLAALGHDDDEIFELLLEWTQRAAGLAGSHWNWKREEKTIQAEIASAKAKFAPVFAPEPTLPLPAGVVAFKPRQQEQPQPEDRPDADPLPPRQGTTRPTVPVRAGHLSEIATEGEAVLLAVAAPFYSRSGRLMRPVIDEAPGADGGTTKIARLVDVTTTAMVDYLARVASWVKYEKRTKSWIPTDPPKLVAEIILSRDGEWKLPPVVGVITTPTLRPDGSILREEGYDAATRLVLLTPPRLPVMPPQPTREDAVTALNLLLDLLTDFSFTDEASRSVALSALITPVVRGAMPVAPCHVMRAPVAGSGKSYLIDISSAISSGQRCPVIAAGKGEEEMEKRLGAALISGQAIVSIDNLNGELKGDALCQMVERPLVQIRLLGQSVLMLIETRATVFATGNNIVIVGDMVRRTLLASMDAELERPELRQFDKKPLNMVLADRGKYIAACLTIVRAYQQAGYPNPCPTLASYDKWSLIVRSALVWLGQADPVDTMENTRAEDPELAALREVVSGWHEAGGMNTPRTVRQIISLSEMTERIVSDDENDSPYAKTTSGDYLNPEFREALQAVAPGPKGVDPRRLGMWLSRQKNRIIDGLKIEGKADGHSNVVKWSLVSARREGGMRG